MFFDAHCHLDDEAFSSDVEQVIKRAKKAGLTLIISNGTNKKSNRAVLNLAKDYGLLKPALGYYPLEIVKSSEEDIRAELDFIESQKENIVAIGEVGLDLYWDKLPENFEKQKKWFIKIIELANKIKKPLIVHSRKAEIETIELLEEHAKVPVIMHSFGGKRKLVPRCVQNGWYFTIPANLERAEAFQKIVIDVPSSQLLTETDAPYLAPVKDTRSEPKDVIGTVKKIAELKLMDEKETKNVLFMNAQRLFY